MRSLRSASALVFLFLILPLTAPAARAADIHWTNAGSGNWDVATNWDLGRIPQNGDDVFIEPAGNITVTYATGTVNINSLHCTKNLALTGGTLGIASASTIGGTVLVTSNGKLDGAGVVTVQGLITSKLGSMTGTGKTIAAGGLLLAGPQRLLLDTRTLEIPAGQTFTLNGSDLVMVNDALVKNLGTIDFKATNKISGTGSVQNQGVLQKSTVGNTAYVTAPMVNTGTVKSLVGTLNVSQCSGTGSYSAASGAELAFGAGTVDIPVGSTVSGAGLISVWGAVVNCHGTLNVTGETRVISGTLNFDGTITSLGNPLTISATANFTQGAPLTIPNLAMNGGKLTIAGDATVQSWTWKAGTIAGAGKTTAVNGISVTLGNTVILDGRTLEIPAGKTLALANSSTMAMQNGATINNLGTIDLQTDRGISTSGSPNSVINNSGVIKKSAGTGASPILAAINNTGGVQALSGTLQAGGGGGGAGTWTAAGATLHFSGGVWDIPAAATIDGAGTMNFGGTVSFHGKLDVSGPVIASGNLTFDGTPTKMGSSLSVTGLANVSTGGPLALPALTVSGTFNVTGDLTAQTLTWIGGRIGGTGKTTAPGSITMPGTTSCTLDGRTLEIPVGRTLVIATEPLVLINGAQLVNLGTIDFQADRNISVSSGSTGSLTNRGTLMKSGGTDKSLILGPLTNSGTVDVSSGSLVANDFTQTAAGTLRVSLAGPAESQIHGLQVQNTAALDGALDVRLLGGFTPTIGDAFPFLHYGSHTGAFASVRSGFDAGYTDTVASVVANSGSTNHPPSAPALSAPADGGTISSPPYRLQLSATDMDSGRLKFKIELLQNGQVVATYDQQSSPTGWDKPDYASGEMATFTVPSLPPGATEFQWRASAHDGRVSGGVSPLRSFNIPGPDAPTILAPAAGAALSDVTVQFQMKGVPLDGGRIRFRVELFRNSQLVATYDQSTNPAGWNKADYAGGETATLTTSLPSGAGTYQWHARVFSGGLFGKGSPDRSFTLTLPRVTLGEEKLIPAHVGGAADYTLTLAAPLETLFLSARTVETAGAVTVSLTLNGLPVVSGGGDGLLKAKNLAAGDYGVSVRTTSDQAVALRASGELPSVTIGRQFVGRIYRNDGNDWAQMDVPAGLTKLAFTLETAGNISRLEVWRGSINNPDPNEQWTAEQSFAPPVKLNIPNPVAGRYYLRIYDHGRLTGSQVRDYSLLVTGDAPASSVASGISPKSGGVGPSVTITVSGKNLDRRSAVSLTGGPGPDVAAQFVDVSADGASLRANFDLTHAAAGVYAVVVTPPGGPPQRFDGAFTVIADSGSAASAPRPRLTAAIVGRDVLRIGRPATYSLAVTNQGTTDALAVTALVSFPKYVTFSIDEAYEKLYERDAPDGMHEVAIAFKIVTPGATRSVPFRLTLPAAAPSEKFKLKAWVP